MFEVPEEKMADFKVGIIAASLVSEQCILPHLSYQELLIPHI